MDKKRYYNPTMTAVRVMAHGQITSLTAAFNLGNRPAFSIFVKPKADTDDTVALVTCKCLLDETASPLPVVLNDWSPAYIQEISASGIDLSVYDVFWGASNYIEPA